MLSYNLVERSWLPVKLLTGERKLVSLTEALVCAHDIEGIFSDSPVEIISLYRFLQALVIRITGCTYDSKIWIDLLKQGRFNENAVTDYLNKWKHRFDLFDKDRPFYQHTQTLSPDPVPPTAFFLEKATANNPTLFDHSFDKDQMNVELGTIAKSLITLQAFSVGGGISKPYNLSNAPYVSGAIFWLRGTNLFQSLLLNLPPFTQTNVSNDTPDWENDVLFKSEKRAVRGYLDYLTWQSRRFLIKVPEDSKFSDMNDSFYFSMNKTDFTVFRCQGDAIDGRNFRDPLVSYKKSKDEGIYSMKINPDKALWRDSGNFLKIFDEQDGGAPRNFEWLANNSNLFGSDSFKVDVIGLVTDQAKVVLWRRETFPFYPKLMLISRKFEIINELISLADRQKTILMSALKNLGVLIFFPNKIPDNDVFQKDIPLNEQERKEISSFSKSLATERQFWSMLETYFYANMEKIAKMTAESYDDVRTDWIRSLHDIALKAYDRTTTNLTKNARQLKALTIARSKIYFIKDSKEKQNE